VGRPVTAAADVYALGAVAYCCLAGRTPYAGDGPVEVLGQVVNGPPPTLPPGVPPAIAAVVTRAMAKDPARRHPSAAALAQAARSALESISSTGKPTPVVRPPAARVAFLGRASPRPTTSGQATEPAATDHVGDRSGTRRATPARTGRRLLRTLAVLAVGVVIGALWATLNVIFGLAKDADDEADTPPGSAAPIRPSPSPNRLSPSTRSPSTPSRNVPANDAPTGAAPSSSAASGGSVTNPYVPRELCGSGFEVTDSTPLRSADTQLGTVYLLADETGARCVVTLKTVDLDEATPVSAYLDLRDGRLRIDGGDYKAYAGPVREGIVDSCVQWGGSVDGVSVDSPPCP
jgi:serine/threonine-protein kinase